MCLKNKHVGGNEGNKYELFCSLFFMNFPSQVGALWNACIDLGFLLKFVVFNKLKENTVMMCSEDFLILFSSFNALVSYPDFLFSMDFWECEV